MDGSVSIAVAFGAGLLSFLSPCVLPLIPSYLSYITGLSFEDLTSESGASRKSAILHALLFVAGFTAVFVAFSVAANYLGGRLIGRYQEVLRTVGGAVIIVLGLYTAGLFHLRALDQEKRVHLKGRPAGYAGSFIVGVAFAAGWSPCIGPILGSILIYAGTLDTVYGGIALLLAYSAGFAVPFLLAAVALNSFLGVYVRFRGAVRWVRVASGLFLAGVGVLLVLGRFQEVLDFSRWFPGG
jgi:cytochrome c-type biogenesis protein